MSNTKKNSLDTAIEELAAGYQRKKDKKIGETILNAVTLPEPVNKIPIYVDISKLYESPSDWNFFKKISADKMFELKESIRENELLYPIQVWNINKSTIYHDEAAYIDNYHLTGTEYMVLAGHNRTFAYIELYEETGDEKYLKIPAFVYETDELTIERAKDIIIDTNYVQRKLSQEEIVKSVMWKYANYDESQDGNKKENIARSMRMPVSTSFRYYRIGLLIFPIQKLIYTRKITADNAIKLSKYPHKVQSKLVGNITNEKLSKMPKKMDENDLLRYFEIKEKQLYTTKVSFDVPICYVEQFKEYCNEYLNNLK